jgi:V8-like Glu-specific endopeptidase
MPHNLTKDNRVVRDRLHARNNPDGADYAFLNAVGAVWSEDVDRSAAGSSASSGFLIDRCHVLTNMHVVYSDDVVVNPAVGKKVDFAVGQTAPGPARGAVLGLRLLRHGVVVAHGDAIVLDRVVYRPEEDWALIRLTSDVDAAIMPMSLAAVDRVQLPNGRPVSAAGFPADHRLHNGDGFNFKDLWGSDGQVVGVSETSTGAGLIDTTVQVTRGSSGGPLYADFDGAQHIAIGMLQAFSGNGIDVSASAPSRQVLFTAATVARIAAAQADTTCDGAL